MAKKVIFFILLVVFFSGCSDPRYKAEKLLWKAHKKTQQLLEGKARLDEKDYDKIISYYREVTEKVPLEPLSSKAHFTIANIFIKEKKYTQAQKELRTVIDNFSSSANIASQAYFSIGRIFEANGEWEKAIEEYSKITDLYPLSSIGLNVPIYIIRHYVLSGDSKGADKAYRSALRHYKGLIKEYEGTSIIPLIKYYRAEAALTKGEFKEAISMWGEIDKDYPSSPVAKKAILSKAFVYEKNLKDLSSAIKECQKFIEKYPRDKNTPKIKFNVAMLFLKDAKVNRAKEVFESLLKDYPSDKGLSLKSLIGLSLCYRKQADTKKVIEIYNRIKKEYPQSRAALSVPFLMGQYYLEMKYNSQAAEAFSKAISQYKKMLEEEKGNFPKREVANLLALCYLKSNQVEKATEMLRSLARRYPLDPVYLIDLATLYRVLNNKDEAIKVYEELIKKFSNNKTIVSVAQQRIKALKDKQ